jgi:hypothetical protein
VRALFANGAPTRAEEIVALARRLEERERLTRIQ